MACFKIVSWLSHRMHIIHKNLWLILVVHGIDIKKCVHLQLVDTSLLWSSRSGPQQDELVSKCISTNCMTLANLVPGPMQCKESATSNSPVCCELAVWGLGPQMRTVPSSDTEANILGRVGFQWTQLTVRVWPSNTAIGSSRRMCHTYTLWSETDGDIEYGYAI